MCKCFTNELFKGQDKYKPHFLRAIYLLGKMRIALQICCNFEK